MVEVIGRDPNYETQCTNCGTKLAFTLKDIKAGGKIPGDHDHTSVIGCPHCHGSVNVTSKIGVTSAETAAKQEWEDRLD